MKANGRCRVINWLVAGAGQAGQCHIAAIKRCSDAVLGGVIDPSLTDDLARASGAPSVFKDFESALSAGPADGLIIATPNDVQAAIAQKAIAAGLPVLCEKPVGVSLAEARALNQKARTAGVPFGVVLNQRAQAHTRWVTSLMQSGHLNPTRVTFTGDLARLTGWHAEPSRSGGGVLRTIGLHYLDLLLWWFGTPTLVKVQLRGQPQEHACDLAFEFESGCQASVSLQAVKERAAGPVVCIIEGQTGENAQRVEMHGHQIVTASGVSDPPAPEPTDSDFFFGPGHGTLVAEATQALSCKEPFPVTLEDVLPALTLIEELYAAA